MDLGSAEATIKPQVAKQAGVLPTVQTAVAIALALAFSLVGIYTYGGSSLGSSPLLLDRFTRFSPGFASGFTNLTASVAAPFHSHVAAVSAAASAESGRIYRHDDYARLQQPRQPDQLHVETEQLQLGREQPASNKSDHETDPLPVGLPTVADSSPVSVLPPVTTASPSNLTLASESHALPSPASHALLSPAATLPSSHPTHGPPPSINPPISVPPLFEPPPSEPPPILWTRIPGSVLDSPDKISRFRERFECIGREGEWSHYVSPRYLPWPDEASKCDEDHLKKSSRHVAFQDADRVVAQAEQVQAQIGEMTRLGDGQAKGVSRQQANQLKQLKRQREVLIRKWTVRETLKYYWMVPENEVEGRDGGTGGSSTSSSTGSKCGGLWEWFDPLRFCQVLDGRRVLIVGDSISMLLADAIRFNVRLGAKDWDSRVRWGEPTGYCKRYRNATKEPADKRCWTLHLCTDLGLSVRLFFVRDYYLNSTEAVNDFMVDKSFDESWMGEIAAQNISIVVMNRGAHYIPDDQFERQMRSTLLALRQTHPDLLIIVRNTPAGHPQCWLHRKPVKQLLKLPHTDWHWDGYAAQNEILKRLAEGVGGVYMDVNASAVWRADGHIGRWDCLHYCHPGPVDTWVQLLHNMLLGLLVERG